MTTRAKSASEQVGSQHESAGESPGFVLWQVASVWQREIRAALAPLGLTHAQFVLLASATYLGAEAAERGEVVTQALIAQHARTDAVMTSEVLRTLEKNGFIERRPHPDDARARQIVVTAAGKRLARKAIGVVEKIDQAFFAEPPPELRALARMIRHHA